MLAYRVGAKLLYADTLQYHPTGAAYPEQIFGALVIGKSTLAWRKAFINSDGEVFMHPLETRESPLRQLSVNAAPGNKEFTQPRCRSLA